MFTIKCDLSYSWAGSKSIAIVWEGYGWWELWERSLPTNVTRVQILVSMPCMGRLNLLSVFSFAPRFFFGYSGFPLFLSTTSKAKEKCPGDEVVLNSNSTRNQVSKELLSTRYWIEYFLIYTLACFPPYHILGLLSSPDQKSLSLVVITWTVLKLFNFEGVGEGLNRVNKMKSNTNS